MQARFRSEWRKGSYCGPQNKICVSPTVGIIRDTVSSRDFASQIVVSLILFPPPSEGAFDVAFVQIVAVFLSFLIGVASGVETCINSISFVYFIC